MTGGDKSPGTGAAVLFVDVAKSYGETVALHPTSFEIKAGEFLSLIGPSGSGKSTLLGVTAGFIAPTQGSVLVNGIDIVSVPPYKRNIGMVFQNYALFPFMTVEQNIAFPLRMRGMSRSEQRARVSRMMEIVRLSNLGDRRPSQLSGGQQQRVALARAAVYDPSILLMDEPLGALDKNLREEMQEEIRLFQMKMGSTVIYVTHDQNEATSMSHRIGVLNHGHIAQIGAPQEMYERPRNRFVANFLGEANLLEIKELAKQQGAVVEVRTAQEIVVKVAARRVSGSPRYVVVRPEAIGLSLDKPAGQGNCYRGRIADVVYTGASVRYKIELAPNCTVIARRSTQQGVSLFSQNQQVYVWWDVQSCSVTSDE